MTELVRTPDQAGEPREPASLAVSVVGVPGNRRRSALTRPSGAATVIVWISVVYSLVPVVWLVFAATKSNQDLFSTFGLWFGHSDLFVHNLAQTFSYSGGIYLRWLANSFWYAAVSAVGAASLATLAGYALAKYRFPGREAVNVVVIGAIMVPMTALAIPTYLLFSKVGITNTALAVVLPSMVSPFAAFFMREYARRAVDKSLIEAARIDGARELRIFSRIALPLLAPGVASMLLFTFVGTFNNYFLPLVMLNSNSLLPVNVGLAQWNALGGSNGTNTTAFFPMVMTGSLVAIVPLVVSFFILQRYWQAGLASGAVKA